MTGPTPPSVPAPPPAHTILVGQAPAPAKTTSSAKAAKTPLVGRPRRPLPPGPVLAAAGTTAAATGTASWLGAVALGASGPVGLGLAAAAVPAGYVAYRRLRRPPAARQAPARGPLGPGGRPSPLSRWRGRRGQQAAGGASAPQRTPGGPGAPARRKGLRGLLPGGQRRSPGGSGGPAGRVPAGSPSGGRTPGRQGGGSGRVARFMPTARGRAARAATGPQGAGAGRGGTPQAGQRRRLGLGRRNRPSNGGTPAMAKSAMAPRGGAAPPAGRSAPRTRAGRAWARRPGGARRAQAAASKSTLAPTKPGGPIPKQHGPAAPGANRRTGAKQGTTVRGPNGALSGRGAGNPPPAKTPPVKQPPAPQVWSTRRKHRRNPTLPTVAGTPTGRPGKGSAVSPRTGKPRRRWNPNLRFGRSGSTKHVPWEPPAPPKGGGVGPVPKPGPKPAGPGGAPVVTHPADPAKTAASARKDAAASADHWDQAARRFADTGHPRAALAAAARAARARADAEQAGAPKTDTPIPKTRRAPARRPEPATPAPQTDEGWAAGFRPGPEPLSTDARTAARDRWPRRNNGGDQMPPIRSGRNDGAGPGGSDGDNFVARLTHGSHAGRGDINGMSELAGLMHSGDEAMAEIAARIERIAATTEDTPSNQAVIEAARAWGAEARQVAGRGAEIAALSQQADATGHQFREEYGTRPNRNMWGD